MTQFVEELATQHLWYWMRNKKNWTVNGEVQIDNGRVDLVAETDNGDYIGVELKSHVQFETNSTVSEQIDRYLKTEAFDRFYVATPYPEDLLENSDTSKVSVSLPVIREACYSLGTGVSEDWYSKQEVLDAIQSKVSRQILEYNPGGNEIIEEYICRKLDFDRSNDPISIDEGLRQINSATFSENVGIIEVPLSITDGSMEKPSHDLTPGKVDDPQILIESKPLSRSRTPDLEQDGEAWVRHHVWSRFGGIPEGHVPNTTESVTADRPIDILTYQDTFNPTEILRTAAAGEIVGIEVKSSNSVQSQRTTSQLKQFLETKSLSRLYFAVPESKKGSARSLLGRHSELERKVGLITVEPNGCASIEKNAVRLEVTHDGYERQGETHLTGYGEIQTPETSEAVNPFRLSEWRETPADQNGNPVRWDSNPRKYIDRIDIETCNNEHNLIKRGLSEHPEKETVRAYLLQGSSAAPKIHNLRSSHSPKQGYVRLTLSMFKTDNDDTGIDLHFGAGSYEGGYIRVTGDDIDQLCSILASTGEIGQQTVTAAGRAIDLKEYTTGSTKFKLKGDDSLAEETLILDIASTSCEGTPAVRMRLCKQETRGVDVLATDKQVLDFLRCLRIVRYGRLTQIPNEGSYKRIGPEGDDTWDRGATIEKSHDEDFEPEI